MFEIIINYIGFVFIDFKHFEGLLFLMYETNNVNYINSKYIIKTV